MAAVIAVLVATGAFRGGSGGGGGYYSKGPKPKPMPPALKGLAVIIVGSLIACFIWLMIAIQPEHDGYNGRFDGKPGHLESGRPGVVVNHWQNSYSTGKYIRSGWQLYLVTEDCPEGINPSESPDNINPGCKSVKHRTKPFTYRNYADGEYMVWDDRDGQRSQVIQHRRGRNEGYYNTVWAVGLEIEQCGFDDPEQPCVRDIVQVHPDLWMRYERGDDITLTWD